MSAKVKPVKLEQCIVLVAKLAVVAAAVMFLQFASFNKIHGMAYKIEEMFVVGID